MNQRHEYGKHYVSCKEFKEEIKNCKPVKGTRCICGCPNCDSLECDDAENPDSEFCTCCCSAC